jgi:hypothetical protein
MQHDLSNAEGFAACELRAIEKARVCVAQVT